MRQPKRVEILADYQQHMRRRGLSESTQKQYLSILRTFTVDADPRTRTTLSIERYLDGKQLGLKGRACMIGCLATFYKWLLEQGYIDTDPCEKVVRPKVPKGFPRPMLDLDLTKAMELAPTRMKCWLALGAYAGLRCKEIAGLRVQDLRLDVDPPVLHLSQTKGNKDRVVPIADEVLTALEAYDIPQLGPVFPAYTPEGRRTQRPLTAHYVSHEICRFLRNIGTGAVAHQLRHWFCTEVYRRTRNPLLVQQLAGHANLSTTSGYMALVPSADAIAAVRSLNVDPDAEKADP